MFSRVPTPLVTPALALSAVLLVSAGFASVWPAPVEDTLPSAELAPSPPPPRPAFAAPLPDVGALEQPVTMTPLMEGGVPRGLLLGAVHEGSLFAHMGLLEGDVLLGFHDLGTLEAPLFVAHLERAGRPMRVEYSVPARHPSRARSAPSLASSLAGRDAAFVKSR